MSITIKTPKEFSYNTCYRFLDRSDKECLHVANAGEVYKLLSINEKRLLIKIEDGGDVIHLKCLNKKPTDVEKNEIKNYVSEWWGLADDLEPFYQFCNKDPMLKKLVKDARGLRLIGFPGLFECIVWAIIGQQINLNFAYIIKQRFVEKYGTAVDYEGQQFFLFPDATTVSQLTIEELKELKFSRQKATYTLNVANAILNEGLNKEGLLEMGYEAAKKRMIEIKGVGHWTADYVLMKCVRYPNAIPLGDVGLHNALKSALDLEAKPSKEMLEKFNNSWQNYNSYICFYLWFSLIAQN